MIQFTSLPTQSGEEPLFLWKFFESEETAKRVLRNAILAAVAGTILAIPFFLQRLNESPDVLRRLGVFDTGRSSLLFLGIRQLNIEVMLFLSVGLFLWMWRKDPSGSRGEKLGAVGLMVAISLVSGFALPLTCLAFGRVVQVPLMYERAATVTSYLLLVFGCVAAYLICREEFSGQDRGWRNRLNSGLAIAAMALMVFSLWGKAATQKKDHLRSRLFADYALMNDYRSDFRNLVEHLSSPESAGQSVIGTLDHQVYAWWCGLRGGYSYLPDPFITTVRDEEVENRLQDFLGYLSLSKEGFRSLINTSYINIFWLSHNKYQANKVHHFSSLEDYSPAARSAIESSYPIDAWITAIPLTEQDRLEEGFSKKGSDGKLDSRLDLIVLNNIPSQSGLKPPAEWDLVFYNTSFRVYSKKPVDS